MDVDVDDKGRREKRGKGYVVLRRMLLTGTNCGVCCSYCGVCCSYVTADQGADVEDWSAYANGKRHRARTSTRGAIVIYSGWKQVWKRDKAREGPLLGVGPRTLKPSNGNGKRS